MILMIDNYDSFTYNLVQYLGELGADVSVYRNDRITLADVERLEPTHIVISPGPGTPDDAGICLDLVAAFRGRVPLLGVCLGHQTIAQALGGRIVHADVLMHGKTSQVHHQGTGLFTGIENPFVAARYHSLVVERDSVHESLRVTAWTDDGEIMGLEHDSEPLFGVQFHPESIATQQGRELLGNFIGLGGS